MHEYISTIFFLVPIKYTLLNLSLSLMASIANGNSRNLKLVISIVTESERMHIHSYENGSIFQGKSDNVRTIKMHMLRYIYELDHQQHSRSNAIILNITVKATEPHTKSKLRNSAICRLPSERHIHFASR